MKNLFIFLIIFLVSGMCQAQNGKKVGQIRAYDPDSGQTLTFEIVNEKPWLPRLLSKDPFAVTKTGMVIINNQKAIDKCNCDVIEFRVRVTDNGNPPANAIGKVKVNIIRKGKRTGIVSKLINA